MVILESPRVHRIVHELDGRRDTDPAMPGVNNGVWRIIVCGAAPISTLESGR